MAFKRIPPILVVQNNAWWCWAACMEMINRAHPEKFSGTIRNQSEWIAAMQASPVAHVALNSHDGLNMSFFGQFTNAIGMLFNGWIGPPAGIPDLAFAESKLHHSLLLAAFRVPGGCHFVVIHSFDGSHVGYTNPAPGTGEQRTDYSRIQSGPLMIAWKL